MLKTFTTDNELFSQLVGKTQHPLCMEANLCQVDNETQDRSYKGFIPGFDDSYIYQLSSKFKFRDGCDSAACTEVIPDSL